MEFSSLGGNGKWIEAQKDWFAQWLGEHVCWLIVGADGMQCDFAPFDVVPEVVELDVNVLSAQSHHWDFGNFESAAIVLKDFAMDHWLG